MELHDRIYVAGHEGFLGSALVQLLESKGYNNILVALRSELDLTNQAQVFNFIQKHQPTYIFLTAARTGGIMDYMTRPADFMYDNLMIQTNVLHSAHLFGIKKVLFYATACLYSDRSEQPISEKQLMEYPLDEESLFYALPKLAGVKLAESYAKQFGSNFISCIPVNLFGPAMIESGQGVVPSLIRKCFDAIEQNKKEIVVWGSGAQRREILHVDDLANASLFLMQNYNKCEPLNVGSGIDFSIKELAEIIAASVGFSGNILYDKTKPEGAKQKLLDSSALYALGFKPLQSVQERLQQTIDQYRFYKKGRGGYESKTSGDFVRR